MRREGNRSKRGDNPTLHTRSPRRDPPFPAANVLRGIDQIAVPSHLKFARGNLAECNLIFDINNPAGAYLGSLNGIRGAHTGKTGGSAKSIMTAIDEALHKGGFYFSPEDFLLGRQYAVSFSR